MSATGSGGESAFRASHGRRARVERRAVRGGFGIVTFISYVFLYTPIIGLIVFSFDKSSLASSWTGFTWHWYSVLFHDPVILGSLKVSAIVGVSASAITTLIALLAAVTLAKRDFRGKQAFMGLMILPLLLPEIVLSIAFLTLLSDLHVTLGYLSLIAGHVVLTLPYATLLLLGAANQLDPSLQEAATDLGCNPAKAFIKVVLPLLLPALLGAFLLAFSVSFGDIVMSNFVSGVGQTPLPVQVYSLLKTGVTPEINALGTLLVVVTLVLILLIGVKNLASGGIRPATADTEAADNS